MVFRFHALMANEGAVVAPENYHFPTPWTIEEQFACFTVRDASGKALGYFYYKEDSRLTNGNGPRSRLLNFSGRTMTSVATAKHEQTLIATTVRLLQLLPPR